MFGYLLMPFEFDPALLRLHSKFILAVGYCLEERICKKINVSCFGNSLFRRKTPFKGLYGQSVIAVTGDFNRMTNYKLVII